ncbi:MAG: hypothetical protein JWP00_2502 [Chloroflexi bacterium]|nr:hypothetical protein [Chloroflexota bacterium]
MPEARRGIRRIFIFYGWVCLAGGLLVLGGLGLLRLLNWLLDWTQPLGAADWLVFGAGLIVVLVSLGPYLATVGQLAGVQKIRTANIQNGPPPTQRERLVLCGSLAGAGLVFGGVLLSSRSLVIWLTFGGLPIFMAVCLFYLAWRIYRIEQAAQVTIYQTDYRWRFDRASYIGVFESLSKNKSQPRN